MALFGISAITALECVNLVTCKADGFILAGTVGLLATIVGLAFGKTLRWP